MQPKISENPKGKIEACESCGNEFSCGAKTEKCWCFEIDLNDAVLAKLRENFKGCLCKDCLIDSVEHK